MNLPKIVASQLTDLGLGKFISLTEDIVKDIESEVEIKVRKMVAKAFDRVCKQARQSANKPKGNNENDSQK